jgi:hypothetical protein
LLTVNTAKKVSLVRSTHLTFIEEDTNQFVSDVISARVESDDELFDWRLNAKNFHVFLKNILRGVDLHVRRLLVKRILKHKQDVAT